MGVKLRSLTDVVLSVVSTLWPLAMDIWENWGIQLLVLLSFIFQIILVHWGDRRGHASRVRFGLFVWVSYMLAYNIAAIALGKLTVLKIRNPDNPEYDVELQGLLAPLLLIHLAYPDCISAYSVEDTRFGSRQVLNLAVNVIFVIWILIRCSDFPSPVSLLYIPLFIAGIIKPGAMILALTSVHDDTTSAEQLRTTENILSPGSMDEKPPGLPDHVLMAYRRFDCLRPHRVNWIYHSEWLVKCQRMSVEGLEPKDAFDVTEIELALVYEAVYTQFPIICTKAGFAGRVISLLCLVSALVGFCVIFRNAFFLDPYVTYTYALLIGSCIMELYQVFLLPFSYWAVVTLTLQWKLSINEKVLRFVVGVCEKRRRWSSSLRQLNLVDYCNKGHHFPKPVSCMLGLVPEGRRQQIKRYWRSTLETFTPDHKGTIINKLRYLEESKIEPFDGKGLPTLKGDIPTGMGNERDFDKCIIIWHIATDILLFEDDPDDSSGMGAAMSKLLSNYMMYLLMCRPYMLSLTTGNITLGYVGSKLKALQNRANSPLNPIRQHLFGKNQSLQMADHPHPLKAEEYKTIVTENWDVLGDVEKVVTELQKLKNNNNNNNGENEMWEFVCSVWVQMLRYAASQCRVHQHVTMLRRGGELITHVWLLVTHKTRKNFIYDDSKKQMQADNGAPTDEV